MTPESLNQCRTTAVRRVDMVLIAEGIKYQFCTNTMGNAPKEMHVHHAVGTFGAAQIKTAYDIYDGEPENVKRASSPQNNSRIKRSHRDSFGATNVHDL